MADYVMKQGDLTTPIFATLTDKNGPVDLPVGTGVLFVSKVMGAATVKTSAAASVVAAGALVGNPDRGRVRYDLQAADVDASGLYEVEWVVSLPTGVVPQRFPDDGYQSLIILQNVTTH